MSEIARALVAIMLAVACAACGFFGARWYDGTLISRTEADLIAQGRADQAAKSAVDIERATVSKKAALKQLSEVRAPVSHACPPGTGAVSEAAFARYRGAQ
jgi:hypothetical protein